MFQEPFQIRHLVTSEILSDNRSKIAIPVANPLRNSVTVSLTCTSLNDSISSPSPCLPIIVLLSLLSQSLTSTFSLFFTFFFLFHHSIFLSFFFSHFPSSFSHFPFPLPLHSTFCNLLKKSIKGLACLVSSTVSSFIFTFKCCGSYKHFQEINFWLSFLQKRIKVLLNTDGFSDARDFFAIDLEVMR